MDDFCSLSRYALEDIDTDAKRKDKFPSGLNGELKIPLLVAYARNYQTLLDQAITLDNNIRKEENRKRKHNVSKYHFEPSHKRHHPYEGSSGHSFHKHGNHHSAGNGQDNNNHNQNGGFKVNNGDNNNGHNGHNHGYGQHRHNHEIKKDVSQVTCFKCNNKGHYANECLEEKAKVAAKPNPFKKGHVNHVNVEEVFGGLEVMNSKYKSI